MGYRTRKRRKVQVFSSKNMDFSESPPCESNRAHRRTSGTFNPLQPLFFPAIQASGYLYRYREIGCRRCCGETVKGAFFVGDPLLIGDGCQTSPISSISVASPLPVLSMSILGGLRVKVLDIHPRALFPSSASSVCCNSVSSAINSEKKL